MTPEEWAAAAWDELTNDGTESSVRGWHGLESAVADAIRAAVAEEREEAAQVADRAAWVMAPRDDGIDLDVVERISKEIARAIRGRPAP